MNPLKQKQSFPNYPQPGPAFPYTVDFILQGKPERYVYATVEAATYSFASLMRNGAATVTLTSYRERAAHVLATYEK
jgi:hypothetical protein